MRLHYWKPDEDFDIDKVEDPCIREIIQSDGQLETSVKEAKSLLRLYGGTAWTCHYERNGGLFEVSTIELVGNNSTHKYNRHL